MRQSTTVIRRNQGWTSQLLIAPMLLALPTLLLADGKSFGGRDKISWFPLLENEQLAAIQHADGVERMVLAIDVNIENPTDRALWIVPIPGRPETVHIDLRDSFPRFQGRDVVSTATEAIVTAGIALRGTQLYPLILEMCLLIPTLSGSRGLDVHAEIEKFGLRSELLSADSVDALAEHLKVAGVNLERSEIADLEPYLNDQHVLVATWIASQDELRDRFPEVYERKLTGQRWPCIYIEFPAEKAFFPLKPTRSYGNVEIPVRLFIVGFVTPQTTAAFLDELRVRYCRQLWNSKATKSGGASGEFDLPKGAGYTSVWLRTTADQFTDDLWFETSAPGGVSVADAVSRLRESRLALAVFVGLLGLLSYVSGGIAGWLSWRRWRGPAKLGLWNLLTVVALNAAARRRSLIERFGPVRQCGEQAVRRQYVIGFSAIFVLLTFGVQSVLMLLLQG